MTGKKSRGHAAADSSSRRRGINSVEIGWRILQCVINLRPPTSLKSIALSAAMDPSQTHRYVSSLVHAGLLKQSEQSGLYDIGPAALQLGLAAIARQDALAVADTAAREFAQRNELTTQLAVWGSYGPMILRWYHGNPPVYTTLSVGSVLPVTRSATGRIFMSFLPDALLNPLLEKEGHRAPLGKNPDLVADRQMIRAAYVASVDGSVAPGLRAHAVPLLGLDDSIVAVLATVAADASPRGQDKRTRAKLVETGRIVSLELGASRYLSSEESA